MGYLKEGRRGVMSLMGLFRAADAEGAIPPAEAAARADIFLAVNASSVELVDVERYCAEWVGKRPLVLWNFELDTLRSDLGASPHCLGRGSVLGLQKALVCHGLPYSDRDSELGEVLTVITSSVRLIDVKSYCAEQKESLGLLFLASGLWPL